VQPELARTLILLAVFGPRAFYQGPIADKIVNASSTNGGIVSKEDFLNYSVEELTPLRSRYRGFDLVLAPPPSSGGAMLAEILNILSGFPMAKLGYHSPSELHFMIEASRHAFADRTLLGDPDYNPLVPLAYMLSMQHASEIRAQINPITATRSTSLRAAQPSQEGVQTTHYSVVDQWGNAVAVTYTINRLFGARCIAGDTGFFLNDEMDDFTSKPGVPNQFGLIQGEQNTIAPGKRPLSSMSPTIVLKDGKPFLITGSPGGSRIITTTLQTIVNVVDYNMDIQSAVDAPRIHHQWLPDTVYYEPHSLSMDTEEALLRMGHTLTPQAPWGSAQSIEIPYRDIQTNPPTKSNIGEVSILLRKGIRYGGLDHRAPAGSARGE
jgi:gamma-glutamyltranspeptidase / glutathione hydrolase